MADPQVFDPNKPYNAAPSATAEGGFDPNKPYEAAPSQLDIARANIAKYPQPGQEENHWMGKLVPQAALPAMQKFTESAPIQASEAIGQKGAQIGKELGHDVVTGADVLTHPMESLAGSLPSPYGPKPIMRSMEQTAREEHPIAYGAAGGIGEAIGGLADPRMAALAVLSGGVDEAYPVLSKIMSGAFGAQMGASTVEGAKDLYTNWDKYTPEQRAEIAAKTGVDAYFTKEALGHTGVPEKIVDVTRPAMNAAVRGTGHAAEFATTPAAIGTAAGGAVDAVGTKLGVPMHGAAEIAGGYMGREMARSAGRNPNEPLVRFPRMTNFGKEPAPRELAPLPEAPKPIAPVEAPQAEAPVDKNRETLQTAYDKANTAYQQAYEAREAYRKSIDQGIQPPVAVQKAFEKAEKALDEAQFHLETYEKTPQAPQPKAEEAPLQPPTMIRGGQHELPGGGVMGKPLQLKGEVPTEAPEHANVADLRARMVPAKEAAGEYTERPISRNVNKAATAQQVSKTGDLIEQGLGGKPLEPNKPIYEKPQQEEAQPPVKEETPAQPVEHPRHMVNANGEALSNAIPKNAEGVELLQKLHDLSNIELRQLAINAGEDMGQLKIGRGKASGNISRPEVFERMLKNHSAEDIGRMVDEGKHLPPISGGSQSAAAAPEPVATNASGESAASQEAINREASDKRQGIKTYRVDSRSQNAVPLFGVDAADATAGKFEHIVRVGPNGEETIMDSGANAKPLTKPVGVERRSTERPATMSATELESAIKNRKPVTTPFDVTEGAMKTIESDKDMPQAPQQKRDANTGPAKDLESYNESIGKPKPDTTKVTKDPRAVEVADAYEAMKHDPDNPQVKKAYNALKVETKAQWEHLKDQGYTMDLSEKDPYKSYEEMVKDVKDNKHISVYDGKESHPPTDHPMSEVDPETGLTYNSLFRAVHDIMGHAAGDNDFSERGEENAYNLHRQAYSDRAIPALTTETKGQTSTFFNNKEVREGAEPGKFPEQKANLLPKEVYEKGAHEVDDAKAKEVVDHIKSGKDFAILQAENPQNNRVSDAKNAELTNRLFKELKSKGYKPVAVGGNTKDVEGTTEHAFFVPDITPEEAVKIGKAYDQQGILTNKGLHDLNTGSINPTKEGALKTGDAARGEQYYTTVGNEDFNVPLDFDKRAPQASIKTARMSYDELKQAGFTQADIDAGLHLPPVSGGAPGEGEKLMKNITPEERKSVEASDREVEKFLATMDKIPEIQEYKDIALAGEGARHWYQRSSKAFDALLSEAPDYFKEGDKDKFIGLLAGSSPRQSVAMNLRESLRGWKNWVDAGRPEMSVDTWKDYVKQTRAAWKEAGSPKGKVWNYRPEGEQWEPYKMMSESFTPATSKVPNIIRSLSGQELWPDLTKNQAFKVPSFDKNLKGWLNYTTNDGWMALFGGLSPDEITNPSSYHPLSMATRAAAKELGWEPAEAQAAIWSFTQALTEAGEENPHTIRAYSEDFADLLAHDPQVREIINDLGVDHGQLDAKLAAIGEKPEVTGRTSATTARSIGKLKERIEDARGKGTIPPPKSAQGAFEFRETPAGENRNRISEPGTENAEDTSFNPDELYERVTPEATNATRKMSNEELLQHGFTQDEIDTGKYLPSVGGSSQAATKTSKSSPITKKLIEKYGTTEDVLGTAQFIDSKGNRIPVQDHDRAVASVLGKNKVNPDDRINYLNDEKAVRVRFRTGQGGKEVVFSVPDKVSPEQIEQMEKTVTALGQFGNMFIEQAHHGGNYVDRVNARPQMVRTALEEVNNEPKNYPTMMRQFHQ